MFAFFAQHFTHQFFKTSGKMGRGFTKALGHGVSETRGHAGSEEETGTCLASQSSLDTAFLAGGSRARVWGQPAAAAPAAPLQRWEAEIPGTAGYSTVA